MCQYLFSSINSFYQYLSFLNIVFKDLGLPRIAYIVTLNFKGMANLEIKTWYHEITLRFYIELNIYNIQKYKNIYD